MSISLSIRASALLKPFHDLTMAPCACACICICLDHETLAMIKTIRMPMSCACACAYRHDGDRYAQGHTVIGSMTPIMGRPSGAVGQ